MAGNDSSHILERNGPNAAENCFDPQNLLYNHNIILFKCFGTLTLRNRQNTRFRPNSNPQKKGSELVRNDFYPSTSEGMGQMPP